MNLLKTMIWKLKNQLKICTLMGMSSVIKKAKNEVFLTLFEAMDKLFPLNFSVW